MARSRNTRSHLVPVATSTNRTVRRNAGPMRWNVPVNTQRHPRARPSSAGSTLKASAARLARTLRTLPLGTSVSPFPRPRSATRLSAIPLPASTLTGAISWNAALADYTEGSEAGAVWDQFVVNESPAGTLGFAAISVNGVGDAVVVALTYEVVATATGTTEFDPALQELSVIDPATGAAVDLLSITTVVETRASVTVQ